MTLEGGNHGFFLQNTPATADGDPNSSDGIFVFQGHFTDLIGGYTPVVGDEIVIRGTRERVLQPDRARQRDARPAGRPRRLDDAVHRRPAGRLRRRGPLLGAPRGDARPVVPTASIVDSPRHFYSSTGDTEFYAISPDVAGLRRGPTRSRGASSATPIRSTTRRACSTTATATGSSITDEGIKAAAGDRARPAPARAHLPDVHGARDAAASTSTSRSTRLGLDAAAGRRRGRPVARTTRRAAFDRSVAYSIANFNFENLYDYRDDPFDGCDFSGNSGCPGVTPPFDYTPASDAEYQARETKIAHQIVDDLHSPDVIATAEAEDQDICTVQAGRSSAGRRTTPTASRTRSRS